MSALPKLTEAARAAKIEVEEAQTIQALTLEGAPIISKTGMENGVVAIAEIRTKHDEVDSKRKSFVDPLKQVIKDIDDFFKPALEALKTAENDLKTKVEVYVTSSLERRDNVLRDVSAAKTTEAKETLLAQADDLVPPKVKGLSIRETWTGEVTDEKKLIKWAIKNSPDLLQVNEKALKALTRSTGRDPEIPGWLAYANRSAVVTPSKVEIPSS